MASKRINADIIRGNYTRRDAFEFKLPSTKCPRNGIGDVVVSDTPKITKDPFQLQYIPPSSLLETGINQLKFFQKERKGYYYVECASHRFSLSDLQDMQNMHRIRDLQRAVQEELAWFSGPYLKPKNVQKYPPDSTIKAFQELLYLKPFDDILPLYDMTPNEMAYVCRSSWLCSGHLCWAASTFNKDQSDSFCCFINGIRDVERLARRRLQAHQPKRLLFFVNVAINAGKCVLTTDSIRGCHWTLCQVDNEKNSIVYADTLGWKIPDGLLEKVRKFTDAVYQKDVGDYELVICHRPEFVDKDGRHSCKLSCAMNYPVQTCSSICGVISMAMAAVAVHKPVLFQQMTSRYLLINI